jgi:suppressor of ftsI
MKESPTTTTAKRSPRPAGDTVPQPPSRPKKILKRIRTIALIVLAAQVTLIASIIVTIGTAAYLYIPRQEPTYPNHSLVFQRQLAIPALAQPRIENGEKVFTLTAQQSDAQLLPGKKTVALGFNGGYLGPTIRAHQGDRIRINVLNGLDAPTTVHWHGMRLPAAMDGGPHQVIHAGATWQPYWTIENAASTLWYHPHLMGNTGEQTYRGMAGLFIVDDHNSDALNLPNDYGVDDVPLIVQDRTFDQNNQLVYEPHNSDALGETGMLGDTILVNGTYAPYLDVPARHIRLRVLNGSNARRYNFGFSDNRAFYQIASDGGLLAAPVARTRMTLAPGERAEIVVDLTGATKPITLISDAVHEDVTVLRFMRHVLGANRDENQAWNILEVRPQATNVTSAPLPQQLSAMAKLTQDLAVKTRTFTLDRGSQTINGKKMDDQRVDEVVHSGDVEIWEVSNRTGTYHPFHIHGVQFHILTRGGKAPEPYEQGWKDTVLIPNGQTVRLIMRFPEFSDPHSPYMYHCHILEHEDMGMMAQFVVVSKDTKPEDIHVDATMPANMDMPGMNLP